jgi:hypothetical protein
MVVKNHLHSSSDVQRSRIGHISDLLTSLYELPDISLNYLIFHSTDWHLSLNFLKSL